MLDRFSQESEERYFSTPGLIQISSQCPDQKKAKKKPLTNIPS
jgi:hypothetical protein